MVNYFNVDVNFYIEVVLVDDQCLFFMVNIYIFFNEDVDDCVFCFQLEVIMYDNEYCIEFLILLGVV